MAQQAQRDDSAAIRVDESTRGGLIREADAKESHGNGSDGATYVGRGRVFDFVHAGQRLAVPVEWTRSRRSFRVRSPRRRAGIRTGSRTLAIVKNT